MSGDAAASESRAGSLVRPLRILVLNEYYWPGVEATAHLLTELCEDLAREFEVTVVTGCLRGTASRSERFVRRGVEIIRVPSTSFDRASLPARAVNYLTFLVGSLRSATRQRAPDVVVCMTDPPLLANIALVVARRYRSPLVVISQDVFPEIAVRLGRLRNPVLISCLERAVNSALLRADRVVAIGDTMRTRLTEKGAEPERISVIPNWVDTESVKPQSRRNEWAREQGLEDRFVVMHSGNVGWAQDLDTLIRASTLLRDLNDLSVVVIGEGARKHVLRELAERVQADAVRFLPYQPSEVVPLSLSSADVHFVGLAAGLAGYVVPSRLYGIMAAARPVIVSADADSETSQLVSGVGCGVVVPPGRVDLVAGAIRDLRTRRSELAEMGRLGGDFVRREASRDLAFGRYRTLLLELAGPKVRSNAQNGLSESRMS